MVWFICTVQPINLCWQLGIRENYLDRSDEIINIFKFYYYSSLNRKELNDLALFFDKNFKQFGLLKNIRWFTSRSRALIFFKKTITRSLITISKTNLMTIARLLKKHVVMLTLLKPLGLFFIGPFSRCCW